MDEKTRAKVIQFAEEVKAELTDNLHSIILYGSAARGSFVPGKSDVNLMIVLKTVNIGALSAVGETLKKYRKSRFADPVVVDLEYLERSADVFPIEFNEIKRSHKIIFGEDAPAQIKVELPDLRLQLERELKQSLLWLRQLIISDPDISKNFAAGLDRAARSLSSQLRAVLMLKPEAERKDIDAIENVEKLLDNNFPALRWLLGLRQMKSPPPKADILNLLPTLLSELGHLVRWVDELAEWQA